MIMAGIRTNPFERRCLNCIALAHDLEGLLT